MQALDINSTLKNAEEVGGSSATSKLAKAWESKQTKNAAKASGLTLMALSLSACGNGSGTVNTTTVNDGETQLNEDAGGLNTMGLALTSNTDQLTGTDGNDVAEAGLVYNPGGDDRVNSLQTEDEVDLGAGSGDTINITLGNSNDNGGSIVAPVLTSVEIVNVEFTSVMSGYSFQGGITDALSLEFSEGTNAVNIERAIGDEQVDYSVRGMEEGVETLSVSGAPNAANVEFNYREGALEDADNSVSIDISSARLSDLDVTIGQGGDSAEDEEGSFENVDITTGGNYANVDSFDFDVNGDTSNADALSQDVTLTLGVDTEFNMFDMPVADTLDISLGANDLAITADETDNENGIVDANGDAVFGLDAGDAGFTTGNLNNITITGSGDAVLNGVDGDVRLQDFDDNRDVEAADSLAQRYTENSTGLTVDASDPVMSGNLHISFTDNVAGDDDSKLLSGSGDDVVRVDTTMMMDVDTGAGNDAVYVGSKTGSSSVNTAEGTQHYFNDVWNTSAPAVVGDYMDLEVRAADGSVLASGRAEATGASGAVVDFSGVLLTKWNELVEDLGGTVLYTDVDYHSDFDATGNTESDFDYTVVTDLDVQLVHVGGKFGSDEFDSSDFVDGIYVNGAVVEEIYQGSSSSVHLNTLNDLGATSQIITGDDDDLVQVGDMLAMGDTGTVNGGFDDEASISTGAGDDVVVVRDMNNAISWDDNETAIGDASDDDNADDRYTVNGTSVDTGTGNDSVTVRTMAEGASITTGDGNDVVTFAGMMPTTTLMEADNPAETEVVSINENTTDEVTTGDFTGASIDLGAGDDAIVYVQQELGEGNVTIVGAGDVTNLGTGAVRGGAVIDAGDGNDVMSVFAIDEVTVAGVSVAETDGTDVASETDVQELILGVETLNLHAQNWVDEDRAPVTGAELNNKDSDTTDLTADIERFDSDLSVINMFAEMDVLPTLNSSELFDGDGENQHFDLYNVRDGQEVNLTARDWNGVNSGSLEDNLSEDVDLDVNMASAEGFNTSFTLNMTGDDSGNALGDFDLDLEIETESTDTTADDVADGGVANDDDAGNIENVTLNIMTATSHGIDMNSFGDSQNTDDDADAIASGAADTSLTIKYDDDVVSASGETLTVTEVRAANITAAVDADVNLTVDAANHYHIKTGSGDDFIDVTADDVQVDRSNTDDVDETDSIDAGAGRDTLVVTRDDRFGNDEGGTRLDDDDWTHISGVEDLLIELDGAPVDVDGNTVTLGQGEDQAELLLGVDSVSIDSTGTVTFSDSDITSDNNYAGQMIVLDEDALETGIQTITFAQTSNNVDASLRLTIGDDFATEGFNTDTLGENALIVDLMDHDEGFTHLRLDNRDDDTLEEVSNVTIGLNATGGAALDAISLGDDRVHNAVYIGISNDDGDNTLIASDAMLREVGLDYFDTGLAGEDETGHADVVSLHIGDVGSDLIDSDDEGHYDEIVLTDTNQGDTAADEVMLLVDNDWIANDTTFTIDASVVTNSDGAVIASTDGNQAQQYLATDTGFDASSGDVVMDQVLNITGSQDDDIIVAGDAADTISGQAGDDWIQGDHVREDASQVATITFDREYEVGDVVQVTINGVVIDLTVLDTDVSGDVLARAVENIVDGRSVVGSEVVTGVTGSETLTGSLSGDALLDAQANVLVQAELASGSAPITALNIFDNSLDSNVDGTELLAAVNDATSTVGAASTVATQEANAKVELTSGVGERFDVDANVAIDAPLAQTITFTGTHSDNDDASGGTGGDSTANSDEVKFNVVYDGQSYVVEAIITETGGLSLTDFAALEIAVEADGNTFSFDDTADTITITNRYAGSVDDLNGVTSVTVDETTLDDTVFGSRTDSDSDTSGGGSGGSVTDLTGVQDAFTTANVAVTGTVGGVTSGVPTVTVDQLITANTEFAADTLTGGTGNDTFTIYKSGQLVDGEHINIDHITDMDFGGDGSDAADAADVIAFGDYFNLASGEVNTDSARIDTIVNQNDAEGETIIIELTGGTFEQAVADLFQTQGEFAEGDQNEVNSAGLFSYEDRDYVIAVGDTAGGFGADDFIVDVTGYTGILSSDDLNI